MKKSILLMILSVVLIGAIVLAVFLVKNNNEDENNLICEGGATTTTSGTATEDACSEDTTTLDNPSAGDLVRKPVIYLYPETELEVMIELAFKGKLTHTYPAYYDGWKVTAKPDGTLTDKTGREYYCLFWEGVQDIEYDMSKGFVVAGSETVAFLEEALATLGLTDKEANEFIIYWLPQMENNKYNLISFQEEAYTDNAVLKITPEPDSVLRIFMTWKALDEPIEIEEQNLEGFKREGFTVVEWGGTEIFD